MRQPLRKNLAAIMPNRIVATTPATGLILMKRPNPLSPMLMTPAERRAGPL